MSAQDNNLDRSVLAEMMLIVGSVIGLYTVVSSANKLALFSKFSDMSVMYTRNNRGPRIDPWGTPLCSVFVSDDLPPTTTL